MQKKISIDVVKNIANRLEKYKSADELAKIYKWPLPVLPNELNSVLSGSGSLNTYAKTIKLREWFGESLKNINEEDRKFFYQWIVKNWGGIRTGKDENLIKDAFQAVTNHCKNFDKF